MRKLVVLAIVAVVGWKVVLPKLGVDFSPSVDLTGKWREVDGRNALDFFPGGGAIVSDTQNLGMAGQYRARGHTLRIGLDGGVHSRGIFGDFEFERVGDELTLRRDGRTYRFRRKS